MKVHVAIADFDTEMPTCEVFTDYDKAVAYCEENADEETEYRLISTELNED